jgi:hypothetical protein
VVQLSLTAFGFLILLMWRSAEAPAEAPDQDSLRAISEKERGSEREPSGSR